MTTIIRITVTALVHAAVATGNGVALMFPECAELLAPTTSKHHG